MVGGQTNPLPIQDIKLIASLKTMPIPGLITKYIKLLESISPNHSSLLSMLIMGSLGGIECPGVSIKDPLYINVFVLNRKHFSFLYFFNAKKDSYLVKMVTQLQSQNAGVTSIMSLVNDWYMYGDTPVVKLFQNDYKKILDNISLAESDVQIQISETVKSFVSDLATVTPLCEIFLLFLENVDIGLLDITTTSDDKLIIKFTRDYVSGYTNSINASNVSNFYYPMFYDLQSICGKGIENFAENKIFISRVKQIIDRINVKWFQGLLSMLNEAFNIAIYILDFCESHLTGHYCNSSTLKQLNDRFYTEGSGIFNTKNLTNAQLVEFLKTLLKDKLPNFIKQLPDVQSTIGSATNLFSEVVKHVECKFDENVFTYKENNVNGCIIEINMESVSMKHQMFFSIFRNNLLYSDSKEGMEKLIDAMMTPEQLSSFVLEQNVVTYCTVNLVHLNYYLSSVKTTREPPKVPPLSLVYSTKHYKDFTQNSLELPLKGICEICLTVMGKEQAKQQRIQRDKQLKQQIDQQHVRANVK